MNDPVEEVRGSDDQPLFPFFTNLLAAPERDFAFWPDFEKQAFIEVFTKIGRFLIEQRRRDAAIPELRCKVDAFDRRRQREPHLRRLADLLTSLGGNRVDDDGRPVAYGIRTRSLKCWDELRDEWRAIASRDPAALAQTYLDAKNRLQRKRRTKFGNSTLFHALATRSNHEIWNNDGDDLLKAWADFSEASDDLEHFETPPSFTPAHADWSPRFFRWSETNNKTHFSWQGSGPFAVQVDARDFSASPPRKTQWLLHYHAPRLLRDGIRGKGDVQFEVVQKGGKRKREPTPLCDWMPPVLRARPELFAGAKQTISGTTVRLMPASRANIQVVLEANLDNTAWTRSRPRANELFWRKDELHERLRWPQEQAEKVPLWFAEGRITCVAIDLGLRAPASYAVMEARDISRHRKPTRFHRAIGSPAFPSWVATVKTKGVVRLSGENRWVYRHPTKGECASDPELDPGKLYRLEELSGARGRMPKVEEAHDELAHAIVLFERLKFPIYVERPGWRECSFPEHNDLLLRAFGRTRNRLYSLNRWDALLSLPATVQQARDELGGRDPADPLRSLLPDPASPDLPAAVRANSLAVLEALTAVLPALADRIMPRRGKSWRWNTISSRWSVLDLIDDASRARVPGAGQRGLSILRIRQIQDLRRAAQSLNHLCKREPGKPYRNPRRGTAPDPFPEAGVELEYLKTQRAKQLAHEIFALAVGVEVAPPPADKESRKLTESLHGIYRPIPGRTPVDFIAIERLGGRKGYRMSEQRSRRENRQLADWGHRQVIKVLTELCELVGLPILHVDPNDSSRFAAFDGCPGFRGEEIAADSPDLVWLRKRAADDDDVAEFVRCLDRAPMNGRLLKPREGGPLFVPLAGEHKRVAHADINAAVNIGFRALAHRNDTGIWPKVPVLQTKEAREQKRSLFLLDPFNVLDGKQVPGLGTKAVDISGGKREGSLWERINGELAWRRCREINAARMKAWGLSIEDAPPNTSRNSADDIPM